MIRNPESGPGGRLISLSPRECDVVRLVGRGKRTKEIAEALGLTPKSAGQKIWMLCQGLGLRGRPELQLWAIQNPLATTGRPAYAGLHPAECECGSVACRPGVPLAA